jgi:hypothetical protein
MRTSYRFLVARRGGPRQLTLPLLGQDGPAPSDDISRTDFPDIDGPELGGHNPFGF